MHKVSYIIYKFKVVIIRIIMANRKKKNEEKKTVSVDTSLREPETTEISFLLTVFSITTILLP